jgi:hypothetical protein
VYSPLDFATEALPSFLGVRPPLGPVTLGYHVGCGIFPPIWNVLVEIFPTGDPTRKSIDEFFGRSARPVAAPAFVKWWGGATSFAEGSTVWPIYPSNSIKSNNNIYKLTSKSQYSDFIGSLFININIELLTVIIKTKKCTNGTAG